MQQINENQVGNAVPADGHFGIQVAPALLDGSSGVASPFGSPPDQWCKRTTAAGLPCKGTHLPDVDHCFAHAPKE